MSDLSLPVDSTETPATDAWPFAVQLAVTFCGLLLVCGATLVFISQRSARSEARFAADRLFREVARHAADQTQGYLNRPRPILGSLQALLEQHSVSPESDLFIEQMLAQLKGNTGTSWISYADAAGRFVGVTRNAAGNLGTNVSYIDATGKTHLTESTIQPDGSRRVTRTDADSKYDPRTREFYTTAVAADGKPVWLDPYLFFGQNIPGITIAAAVMRDGRPAAVLTVDSSLDILQHHLTALKASDHSLLYVFTSHQKLVATQQQKTATTLQTLPELKEADATLAELFEKTPNQERFDFTRDGEQFFAAVLPFDIGVGQHWYVGVVAPAEDFLSGVHRTERNTAAACTVALLLAILTVAAVARRVSRPVSDLTAIMSRIGNGDLDATARVGGAREFRNLSSSLNTMVRDLRDGLRLRHSIGVAMQVQRRLLPEKPPVMKGLDIAGHSNYCDETGGDYYDFLTTEAADDRHLVIVVGDVMGHGIGSALVMASARAVLRDRVAEAGTLAQLLQRLNGLIRQDTDGRQFMTMFMAVVDADTGHYRFASAGHDPALLYHAATGEFEEVDEAGLPLGIMEDGLYVEHIVTSLAVGDTMLIGTDGVWEMHGPGKTMFGKERLRDIIQANAARPAKEIADEINAALDNFRESVPVKDDVTFVVVKRTAS